MTSLLDLGKKLVTRNPIIKALNYDLNPRMAGSQSVFGIAKNAVKPITQTFSPINVRTMGNNLSATFAPQTGSIATAGRNVINRVSSIPVPKQYQRPITNFFNTVQQNPISQFGAGLIQGQNLGLGRSPIQAPQSNFGRLAYGTGSLAGALNPKSITGRVVGGIVRGTNPILSRVISPVANKAITGRVASGLANVAQGSVINPLYGRKPLEGAALDFATGVAFGPNQFNIGRAMDQGYKSTGKTWHPEDAKLLDSVMDKINKIKLNQKTREWNITTDELNDLDKKIGVLAQGYMKNTDVEGLLSQYGKNEVGFLQALGKKLQQSAKNAPEYTPLTYSMGIKGNQQPKGVGVLDKQIKDAKYILQNNGFKKFEIKGVLGADHKYANASGIPTKAWQQAAKELGITEKSFEEVIDGNYYIKNIAPKGVGVKPQSTVVGIKDVADVKKRLLSVYSTFNEADRVAIQKAKTAEDLSPYLRKLEGGSLARFFNSGAGQTKNVPQPPKPQSTVGGINQTISNTIPQPPPSTPPLKAPADNFEKDFGRSMKEQEFRKLENDWVNSFKQTAPQTAKQHNIQTRKVIGENERAVKRAVDQWATKANPGVVKPYKKGELGKEQPFKILPKIRDTKDKSAFSYNRETAVRNIEDTFGSYAPEVKKFTTDKITENETNAVKFGQEISTRLKATVNKYGIGKGSKEDQLVFKFAEGKIDEATLRHESKKADGIIKTAAEFRKTYDELLDRINASLTQYGYDPIPKRKDYMTHFQEVGSFFDNFGMMFKDQSLRDNLSDKLPTSMSGINMDTKPGKEFFKFALPRTGDKTTESAIGAMERYLDPATRQIFHTDSVQRIRALQDMIVQHQGKQGRDLSEFNSWLSEYGNLLAGKKSVIDRPVEKIFGRGLLQFGNWLRKRTGANMVGGNISSALTNFIPFTQSLATTSKRAFVRGMMENLKPGTNLVDGVESSFLTRRFKDLSISKNLGEKISSGANTMFKYVDQFTAKSIVSGKYFEGIQKGLDPTQAMRQADDYAARIMADRSFGATPTLFNSKVLGALTQFQLEVNNQLSFMFKDVPKNLGYDKAQIASSLTQIAVYSYVFNELYQKMTGRRPAFDPLGIGIQAFQDYTNEDMKKGQATKNLVENVSNSLPFTSMVTGGRIPMEAALPSPIKIAKGESTLKKEVMKPLTYLLPPTAGGQIKKTIEGLNAYAKEGSYTDSEKLRFPITQNPGSLARSAIFGQYSSPEAAKYFRTAQAPLGEKDSKIYKSSSNKQSIYDQVMANRKKDKLIESFKSGKKGLIGEVQASDGEDEEIIKARMKYGELPDVYQSGSKYYITKDDGGISTIDITSEIPLPKTSKDPELNKKLKSQYKSKLTSRQTDITNLYSAGAITEEEAIKLWDEVEAIKVKAGGGKKPKKITVSAVKVQPIKIISGKSLTLKPKSLPKPKKTKDFKVIQSKTEKPYQFKKSTFKVKWS